MATPRNRAAGSAHVLLNRSQNGDRVLLEDRSIWKIDPSEMNRASRWPQWTRVRVEEAGGKAYWLIAEVLGQRECVLAVPAGALPRAAAPVAAEACAPATSDFSNPEL